MRIQQLALLLSAFFAGCHALPNDYEGPEVPEAFKRELINRAVGGNCNFTGTCAQGGVDRGECIGESAARCCSTGSFNEICTVAGNACEFNPGNNSPAICS